jgi:hypothetical protein
MAWLKIDDGFPEHPRVDPLTHKAFRLHVTAMCLAARKLTDGYISEKDARLCRMQAGVATGAIAELEGSGLWERNGDGWHIRDYLDYNPSAEQVKAERERAAERMRHVRANVRKNVRENKR